MSKFKVGDKVRIKDDTKRSPYFGFSGIVSESREASFIFPITVMLTKDRNGRRMKAEVPFPEDEVELVNPESINEWEQRRRELNWPTPNAMRSAAEAVDHLSPAKYGDILRFVADLCDEEVVSKRYNRTASLEAVLDQIDEALKPKNLKDKHRNQLLRSKGTILVALMEDE